MTQSCTNISPKQAAQCCSPVDTLLDPELFKALCDPTRALILACLIKCARPCAVSEIAECCAVDTSVVSRHLATLARAGLLDSAKQGRTVSYAARADHLSRTLRALADAVDQSRLSPAAQSCC
ncbi:MAG: winged helix-turn-helix transcriptional regulator [Phycisphaeraceae bacterium]|nr:winged helix-turn-helix transcriptional regulator [Phycisphaerales bacterium]MCB9844039.1 winged helix-turn-helix transcriptional regulator [Phycisphaeraceae bacterium]